MRMSTFFTRMAVGAVVALTPVIAFAADEAAGAHGDDGHGEAAANPMAFNLVPYISALVVFGLAFFILSRTAWPKITRGLDEREQKIKGEIAEAERTRKQAERALNEYEQALSEARNEAAKMLEAAKSEQQQIAAELRAKTESEVNSMREAAKSPRSMATWPRPRPASLPRFCSVSSTRMTSANSLKSRLVSSRRCATNHWVQWNGRLARLN
jgi:vacuolar-type H+-ATPase subunit H